MDRSILVGAAVFLAAACSVRENRTDCPCRLRVVFTDPGAAGTADLLGWDGDALFRERVRIEECRPDRERNVSRGHFVLSAWQGTKASSAEGHRVVLPPGKQFDSLYACFSDVDATGDVARAEVTFRKQFATVFLDIRKPAGTARHHTFSVEGNSCGFDLLDFGPVPGPFSCSPQMDEDGVVRFRIPRQADDALSVAIRDEEGFFVRFPLGKYVAGMGYDWTSEELQDIYVSADLVRGSAVIRIADWEEGVTFPFIEL